METEFDKIIQGDSGVNVDIYGGNSIVHCEKESANVHVSNSESKLQKALTVVKKERQNTYDYFKLMPCEKKNCYTGMTKFVTVHSKYSNIPPSTWTHFATRARR